MTTFLAMAVGYTVAFAVMIAIAVPWEHSPFNWFARRRQRARSRDVAPRDLF